jgi:hypothetical protein
MKTDSVPCFYREQDDAWEIPKEILTRAEAREKKNQKLGKFENNGQTFRLFESRPVAIPVYREDEDPANETGSSQPCISFEEMQANVGIVRECVRNERGLIQMAQAKVRWYPRIRSYPELASGRWAIGIEASA